MYFFMFTMLPIGNATSIPCRFPVLFFKQPNGQAIPDELSGHDTTGRRFDFTVSPVITTVPASSVAVAVPVSHEK